MKRIVFSLLFFLCLASPGLAANIYVDKDNSCPGTGTTGDPYCSIQNAFNAVSAGDIIKIRDAATAYDQNAVLSTSGTSASVITIMPDAGHNPTIRYTGSSAFSGAIQTESVSHVVIDGLNCDGTGIQTSKFCIYVKAGSSAVTGIVVKNMTCQNWGGTGANTEKAACVRIGSASTAFQTTAQIFDNAFDNNRSHDLDLLNNLNSVVERNTITNALCGKTDTNRVGHYGIFIQDEGSGYAVRQNSVDFNIATPNCTGIPAVTTNHEYFGIYLDRGPENAVIERNRIRRINSAGGVGDNGLNRVSAGIFIESRADNAIVKFNVISDVGQAGLRQGSSSLGPTGPTTWIRNTVWNVGVYGFWSRFGPSVTFKNNILQINSSGTTGAIKFESASVNSGGHSINGNIYYDPSGSHKIGGWGAAPTTFAAWKTACGCDANAQEVDPGIDLTNGYVQSLTDPGVGAGVSDGLASNGAVSTIGAFDPPRFSACVVENATPNRVDVTFTNNVAPPIITGAVTGITIQVAAGDRTESSPTVNGTSIIQYTIDGAAVTNGQAVTWVAAATNTITDKSLVGNSLNQPFLAIAAQNCTNNVGAGGPAWTLTQSKVRGNYLPASSDGLDPAPTVGNKVKVQLGGAVIAELQVDATGANAPAFGAKLQRELNLSGTWVDIPSTDDGVIYFRGTTETIGTVATEGQSISGCIDATGLTAVAGSVQRTPAAVPNNVLNQNQCKSLGFVLNIGSGRSVGDVIKLRLVNQDGTVFAGTYVLLTIEIMDRAKS